MEMTAIKKVVDMPTRNIATPTADERKGEHRRPLAGVPVGHEARRQVYQAAEDAPGGGEQADAGVRQPEGGLELRQDEHGTGVEDVLDGVTGHHRDEHEHSDCRLGRQWDSGATEVRAIVSPRIEFGAGAHCRTSPSAHVRRGLEAHLQLYLRACGVRQLKRGLSKAKASLTTVCRATERGGRRAGVRRAR